MKKYKWAITIVAVAIAGAITWFYFYSNSEEIIVLETNKIEYGNISSAVTATGTLQPVDTVAVGSQVSGTIKKVYTDFNSKVKKGQLLAQLDKSLMEAQVQQYIATRQQAQANVVYQQNNYKRQAILYAVDAISKADLETAVYQYSSAKDVVSSITAQLNTAKKNLSFTDIYSPIDGTVLSRSVSEGQTVAASLNTPTFFSIAKDLSQMQVQASVDEADIGNVKQGQRAIFSVDAFPADTFSGTVKEIRLRSTVTANVVTYITLIDAPNSAIKLKPGMTANIIIYTREINHTLLAPAAALVFAPDSVLHKKYRISSSGNIINKTNTAGANNKSGQVTDTDALKRKENVVWIKKDSISIVRVLVITGLDDKTEVQIISGLKEGDIVISGYEKIQKKDAAAVNAAKSPFMPARGGRRPPPH